MMRLAQAQTFTPSNTNTFITPNGPHSDLGDYDNDGDLDIVINGSTSQEGSFIKLYNNDGFGNFSLNPTVFSHGISNGEIEFVDYDNDNDLDIFSSGWNTSGYKTILYRNDSGVFNEVLFSFVENTSNSQFQWSDLDNDGDLDFIVSGNYEIVEDFIHVYRNDGNDVFTEINALISAYSQGAIRIADLDNDGDNDVIIGGLSIPPFITELKIYRNDGDFNFVNEASLNGFANGDLELRDCNKDGYIDILYTGDDFIGGNLTEIYYNDGAYSFIQYSGFDFPDIGDFSKIISADYNGNGELDFLLSGRESPYTVSEYSVGVYSNNGDMALTENTITGLPVVLFYNAEIGDLDNDNDIDVFVVGPNMSSTFTNTIEVANTAPSTPLNLQSNVTGDEVVLTWDSASDLESPDNQLSYNVYVGTSSGSTDIVTPMADVITGYRKIVSIGNAQYKTSFSLKNLADGTYFWSVQAIDNQYEGSLFAVKETFVINSLSVEDVASEKPFSIYPNPTNGILNIRTKRSDYNVYIYNALGALVYRTKKNDLNAVDLSGMSNGVYFIKFFDSKTDSKTTIKVVKY